MKKIKIKILCIFLVIATAFVLLGCDQIKQAISDVVGPEIENQINELLGLSDLPRDDQFTLPAATRYENFKIQKSEDGKTTTYAGDVFEPKVEFVDYAEELSRKLGSDFTKEEIQEGYDQLKQQEKWTFVDESGVSYSLSFKEILNDDNTVNRWSIEVTVYDPNYLDETINDTPTE